MGKTEIAVASQSYLEGKITDDDYKVIIYSCINKSGQPYATNRRAIASSILNADKTFLETFAKGVIEIGE